jgi:hypothetical protein
VQNDNNEYRRRASLLTSCCPPPRNRELGTCAVPTTLVLLSRPAAVHLSTIVSIPEDASPSPPAHLLLAKIQVDQLSFTSLDAADTEPKGSICSYELLTERPHLKRRPKG